jgi:hypothetical protein
MSKKKKKVTAPLTYDPGKGRPKEYLAYLNYQEMQALKRLNGEGPYKGPKGLPSFVLGGAKTSGTAANSAMKSASQSSGSRPSSGGRDGGIRDSVGANRPSSSGASRGDVGGRDSGTRDSVGANRPSSPGASRGDVAGRDGGIRNVAGANTPDKSAISSANRTNTVSAQKSPAFKADTGRTVNVGPMGTPVNVKAPPGGKIKGAIQSVKQTPVAASRSITIPERTVVPTSPGAGGGFGRVDSAQKSLTRGSLTSPVGPTSGVTAPRDSYGALQERLNQRNISESYRSKTGYPSAPQGVYGPRAGVDTRYLGTKDMPGMITTSMTSPYSGTVAPRSNAASTLRAYEEAKRVPGKIQDRVPPTERFRPPSAPPSGRVAVPGLITEPSLNRPMTNADAFNQYARMVNPTDLPISRPQARGKQIQDRITPSQNMQRPPSVGRSAVVPTDAGIIGSFTGQKQIYDRVLPESEYSGYGSFGPPSAPGKTRGIGDVPLPQSQYSGYGAEGYSTLSGIPTPQGYGSLPQYPNYRPPSESSAYDPRRLAAYDSTFGPELLGASGSEIEKALLNEEFRRQAAGTVTSPYDVAPSYPNYGPPSKNRGLGGLDPAASPYNNVSSPSPQSMPYDVRLGEVKVSVPMRDEDGNVKNNSATIDSYVDSMPDLNDAEKSVLRRSMIGNASAGNVDYTKEDVEQMIEQARGEVMVPGDETPANDYVDGSDVYGPENVSPEAQKKLKRDEVINKVGVNIIKFRNPLASLADAASKLLTGKGIADSSADLKRAYLQASDEQKAALEDKYPNLTKFASDAGLTPKRDMSNYTKWADKSGLRGAPDRRGGGENSGIRSLISEQEGDETTTPEPDTPSTSPGRRPDIYYMWDLGVNVPSPSDPNYNQYQTYLAERLAAQRAMG